MELRALRAFEAVARHRHFTRAAGELHLAQSALSHQVRRLEAELGVALLTRTSRRVELTEAGAVVLVRARRILAEAAGVVSDLDELRGLVRGSIGIGAMMPVGRLHLPSLIARFHASHPGVDVHLREVPAAEMAALLRRDALDLGFSFATAPDVGPGVDVEWLAEEELVAMVGPGDPRGGQGTIALTDLHDRDLIGFLRGSAMRTAVDAALAGAGAVPRLAFESLQLEMVRALAAQGLGVGIVPRTFAEAPGPDVALLAFDPPFVLPVNLLRRAGRRPAPAAAAFEALLREALV